MLKRGFRHAVLAAGAMAAGLLMIAADLALAEQEGGVDQKVVASEKLSDAPGNSLTAVEVELAPSASVPSHRHGGFVFAYVLAGTIRSQLDGDEAVEYQAGQSWVEPPGTMHTLFENPSQTDPARMLAVFVAPEDAELTTLNEQPQAQEQEAQ